MIKIAASVGVFAAVAAGVGFLVFKYYRKGLSAGLSDDR